MADLDEKDAQMYEAVDQPIWQAFLQSMVEKWDSEYQSSLAHTVPSVYARQPHYFHICSSFCRTR
jgi:hypothetical protein